MRNLFWLLLISMTILSCSGSRKEYQMTANLSNINDGWVYLAKLTGNELTNIDSVQSADGKFTLAGEIESPELLYLTISGGQGRIQVFTEPTVITISGTIDSPQITGSQSQLLYDQFQTRVAGFSDQRNIIYDQYQAAEEKNDTMTMKRIEADFDNIDKSEKSYILDFAKANTSSVVSPFVVLRYSYYFELGDLEDVLSTIDPSIENSRYTADLNERIRVLRTVEIGQPAPFFTQNDTTGNPVSLKDFQGQYVLIDFWASWCGPCRVENPNVVEAFNKYNSKGFTVLGVSLDRDKSKWLNAIVEDHLTWTHVSDLKFWDNEVSKLYGVRSIPASFLIDKEGKIIAKDLRENKLHEKLAELLD